MAAPCASCHCVRGPVRSASRGRPLNEIVGHHMSDGFREDGQGICDACGLSFPYMLIHNGFNDSAFAYCDSCGRATLLDLWTAPSGLAVSHGSIPSEVEPYVGPCPCGGRFRGSASPRCPSCRHPLNAEAATSFIEANAPGSKKGWRWQRSWQGLYCVVVAPGPIAQAWVKG